MKNRIQRALLAGAFTAMALGTANAQSDIAGVTTAVSGYATAAIAVGITIMLFVIGRGVVRKLAK